MTCRYCYHLAVLVSAGEQVALLVDLRLDHLQLMAHRRQVLRPVQAAADASAQLGQFGLKIAVGPLELAEILRLSALHLGDDEKQVLGLVDGQLADPVLVPRPGDLQIFVFREPLVLERLEEEKQALFGALELFSQSHHVPRVAADAGVLVGDLLVEHVHLVLESTGGYLLSP